MTKEKSKEPKVEDYISVARFAISSIILYEVLDEEDIEKLDDSSLEEVLGDLFEPYSIEMQLIEDIVPIFVKDEWCPYRALDLVATINDDYIRRRYVAIALNIETNWDEIVGETEQFVEKDKMSLDIENEDYAKSFFEDLMIFGGDDDGFQEESPPIDKKLLN